MTEEIFQIGIKAIIINDKNEILLLKSGPAEEEHTKITFWDLPGGRIQEGHTIEDTLRREVEEELGISSDLLKIDGIFDATISNFKKSHHHSNTCLMLIAYKCELKSNKFKLSDEHSEYGWFSAPEAKKLLSTKFPKNFTDRFDSLDA